MPNLPSITSWFVAASTNSSGHLGGHFHGLYRRVTTILWLQFCFVVVDRFSKYSHFILLSHPFTVKVVATEFLAHAVKLHGFPKSIVTDKDRVSLSNFWSELFCP